MLNLLHFVAEITHIVSTDSSLSYFGVEFAIKENPGRSLQVKSLNRLVQSFTSTSATLHILEWSITVVNIWPTLPTDKEGVCVEYEEYKVNN